jgi:hypothetical protein
MLLFMLNKSYRQMIPMRNWLFALYLPMSYSLYNFFRALKSFGIFIYIQWRIKRLSSYHFLKGKQNTQLY